MPALLLVLLVSVFFFQPVAAAAPAPPEWEDPAVFAIGTERPRATFVPHASREAALTGDRTRSPHFKLLNGSWRFRWVRNPFELPAGFERPDFVDASWDSLVVPSNWQVVGASEGRAYDRPFFSNIKHPFTADPPKVPHDDNPVGIYRTRFDLPENWADQRVFLHFAGVQSAYYVWVNGVKVGYREDAFTPGEFDITPHLHPGANVLAVEVIHHSDGSYLEDQDYWRLAGIFRDVFLLAQPRVRLRDFGVKTDLDASYRDATLALRVASGERGVVSGSGTRNPSDGVGRVGRRSRLRAPVGLSSHRRPAPSSRSTPRFPFAPPTCGRPRLRISTRSFSSTALTAASSKSSHAASGSARSRSRTGSSCSTAWRSPSRAPTATSSTRTPAG